MKFKAPAIAIQTKKHKRQITAIGPINTDTVMQIIIG